MSCLSSARCGLLLASFTATALSAAPLSPADQNAIEQQQKTLLEQTQQQRDMLRNSTPTPSLPTTASAESGGKCFELFRIRLDNVTVLPRSVLRKLTAIPAEGCMTLKDIQLRVRDVTQDYLSRGYITLILPSNSGHATKWSKLSTRGDSHDKTNINHQKATQAAHS